MSKKNDKAKNNKETDLQSVPEYFKELCCMWLNSKKNKVKYSTYSKYKYILDDYIIPKLGEIELVKIHIYDIEGGLHAIYEDSVKKISVSLMKSVVYVVNAILEYGIHLEYFQIQKAVFELPAYSYKEISVFSKAEEQILLEYLYKNKNENSLGIMISLLTGMRLGEICSLQKKNFDIKNSIISVRTTVQRLKLDNHSNRTSLIITEPKSIKSIRDIPVPIILKNYMETFNIDSISPDKFLLTNSEIPYEPRTLQYAFENILNKCTIKHAGFHCLRHTFATNCIKSGVDVKTLSEILGHTSVTFTLNRYVHADIEHKKNQMELFNSNYMNMVSFS